MNFIQVCHSGYYKPAKFAAGLQGKPAPHWGFYAVVLRAALLSLLMYLPLSLQGSSPPTPSYLSALPTERYYTALIWLTPLVLFAEWLLAGALAHVILRLVKRPSDFDSFERYDPNFISI